jgi:hypothetical protein
LEDLQLPLPLFLRSVVRPLQKEQPFIRTECPQLDLWQLSETEWLLALRRPDLVPRRNRGKLVALARQLPLPFSRATG